MTVEELLRRISAMYPGASPEALAGYKPVFLARLKHREGPHLEDAAITVFGSFKATSRSPFPIPAEFEAHLPAKVVGKAGTDGPPLDWEGRAKRYPSLLAEWSVKQGQPAAKGIPEVYLALRDLAEPLLLQAAWHRDARPVYLTRDQLRIARQRALSQRRLAEFGGMPKDPTAWWSQIDQIQQRWGITLTMGEWTEQKREQEASAA